MEIQKLNEFEVYDSICQPLPLPLVAVVYIFRYFRLYLQKSNKKNKEEGRSGTTGTGVSQKDLQRGAKQTNKKCY